MKRQMREINHNMHMSRRQTDFDTEMYDYEQTEMDSKHPDDQIDAQFMKRCWSELLKCYSFHPQNIYSMCVKYMNVP